MLIAASLAGPRGFELAILAAQVLLFGPFFLAKSHLAVDHASEVDLLALVALVEGA